MLYNIRDVTKMLVELVDYTRDAEVKIATAAAICYNSKTTDGELNERRIKHLLGLGHLATLRFAYATFRISEISRACANQMVRSKHLDFLQESQRYVKQSAFTYVMPEMESEADKQAYINMMEYAQDNYDFLISKGYKKEDARMVLPIGAHTKLYVVGNFQSWGDFIKLRSNKAAQSEIRGVALQIKEQLNIIAPTVFPLEN